VIKATLLMKDGTSMLVLGLSRENTNRLHEGKPIPVKVAEVDPRLPELTVLIIAGETEDAIIAEVQNTLGDRLQS